MSGYRRAVVGLIAAVGGPAIVTSVASATISPVLTLDQSSGTTAGTNPYQMGYDLKFNPSPRDWPKDLTTILPAGLLANASLAGGPCLTFSSPQSACQIPNGTATVGGSQLSAAQYLVQAPKASDVAGVALVIGGNRVDTGDLTLRTSPDVGLNLTFANLPPGNGLSELNVTLSNLRLPTNCPAPPADVTVKADSQDDSTNQTANAPLAVTGCGSLPYLPKL